jgi:hypothetical protein
VGPGWPPTRGRQQEYPRAGREDAPDCCQMVRSHPAHHALFVASPGGREGTSQPRWAVEASTDNPLTR